MLGHRHTLLLIGGEHHADDASFVLQLDALVGLEIPDSDASVATCRQQRLAVTTEDE